MPKDKVISSNSIEDLYTHSVLGIEGLDVDKAIGLVGSVEIYLEALEAYVANIDEVQI